jgi:hypothetical protein
VCGGKQKESVANVTYRRPIPSLNGQISISIIFELFDDRTSLNKVKFIIGKGKDILITVLEMILIYQDHLL